MKTTSFSALLLVAASITARTTSKFTISSGTTEATTSATSNVNFVKQWTLTAGTTSDTIDSIDLDLVGRVYVSYMSGLPSGVLGYVNVSGVSQTVVDAVTVRNDVVGNVCYGCHNNANYNNGVLNVLISNGTTATTTLGGYLLTEIFLSASGAVTDVSSQRSAQVVIEDGVLVSSSTTAELQVEATGSSAVYVSAASTAVSVRQLILEVSGTAILQFNVASLSVSEEALLEALGSGSISVLGSSVEANLLELDVQNPATICLAAQQVTATNYDSEANSQISMPNASRKYSSTGSFACDESSAPAREPACVSSACTDSSSSSNTATVTGSGTQTTTTETSAPATNNDDETSDDTNASASVYDFMFGAVTVVALATSLL